MKLKNIVSKTGLLKVLVGVMILGSLVLVEVITYKETTNWITEEATHYYNGKNDTSFLVSSR
jgi:hypothetical protein